MTDNSKKVSELPTAANVALTDRVMVLRDPAGTPSVRTITVANLAIGFPSANTTSAGVIKVGNNLSVNATGFLSTNVASDKGVYPLTYINTASYNVASTDVILLVDPNSLDANVRIVLPTSNVATGRQVLIKNINPGANRKVNVTTDAGILTNSNYLEDPVTGSFVVSNQIGVKGESHTWIWDGTVYRCLASLSDTPVFYASTNSYHQVVAVNPSNSNDASVDFVAYNNLGDYAEGTGPYIDMGINSSTYANATYSINGPSDGYIYNNGGDLTIGTANTSSNLVFHTGGTTSDKARITISDNTVNVSVNNFTFSGILGPFASDGGASAGGVLLKGLYYDSSGNVKIRLT